MAREKVTESTSTLEAQRVPGSGQTSGAPGFEVGAGDGAMEMVADPGPVKTMVFEATAAPPAGAPGGEGEYQVAVPSESPPPPAAAPPPPPPAPPLPPALGERGASIHSIRREVDEMGAPDAAFAGAPRRANLQSWRSTTVYRTETGGEVRAYEGPSGRTLTLAGGGGERRFTEAEVDRVISGITLRPPAAAEEPAAATAEAAQEAEEAPRRRSFFGLRRRKAPEGKAQEEDQYQPQCAALTEEGVQCRNSAREGSKYCSSHFGYQPRTAQGMHGALDTEPRFDSSRDTVPGAWEPTAPGASAQCTALTREGRQCQNPTVAGSPHCGSHQGYQEPTATDIVAAADTKPRWARAKDTKPATRKAAGAKGRGRRR